MKDRWKLHDTAYANCSCRTIMTIAQNFRCETALTNMNTPYEVVQDNLATRSIRVAIDLVDDEVNQALNKVLSCQVPMNTFCGNLDLVNCNEFVPTVDTVKLSLFPAMYNVYKCTFITFIEPNCFEIQEVEVINGIKAKLQQKVNEAFQQLWSGDTELEFFSNFVKLYYGIFIRTFSRVSNETFLSQ